MAATTTSMQSQVRTLQMTQIGRNPTVAGHMTDVFTIAKHAASEADILRQRASTAPKARRGRKVSYAGAVESGASDAGPSSSSSGTYFEGSYEVFCNYCGQDDHKTYQCYAMAFDVKNNQKGAHATEDYHRYMVNQGLGNRLVSENRDTVPIPETRKNNSYKMTPMEERAARDSRDRYQSQSRRGRGRGRGGRGRGGTGRPAERTYTQSEVNAMVNDVRNERSNKAAEESGGESEYTEEEYTEEESEISTQE